MERINGKQIATEIKQSVRKKIEKKYIKAGRPVPALACIIVEGNSASEVYVASKERACAECGMRSEIIRLPQNVKQEELCNIIQKLNADNRISGILLQLPLPSHLDEMAALSQISSEKDVDCLTNVNLGALLAKNQTVAPCTATGIIKILDHENISIAGKRAVVVGRSLLVGKSVACLLEQRNATVTLCHSKTQCLSSITSQADILVVAIGKAKFIKKEFVKPGAVVIDVGINRIDGKLYGDVDYDDVCEKCSYITPVPGGVGPLTVACLMENTLTLHEKYRVQ